MSTGGSGRCGVMMVSRIRKLFLVLGLICIGAAVVLTVRPETGLPAGLEGIGTVSTIAITLLLVIVFGLYGLLSFRASGMEEDELVPDPEPVPELVEDDETTVIGFDWDDDEQARASLSRTVEEVLVSEHGYTEDEAAGAVGNGSWTRDRVAAAFIDTGITYPVLERLRGWLEDEGTFDRRLERTVRAIEGLYERGDGG